MGFDPRGSTRSLTEAESFEALEETRAGVRDEGSRGMLKRRDSLRGGTEAGLCTNGSATADDDCVMMYAQSGSGKRRVL